MVVIADEQIPAHRKDGGVQSQGLTNSAIISRLAPEMQSYIAEMKHEMSEIVQYHQSNIKTPVGYAATTLPTSVPTGPTIMRNGSGSDLPPSVPKAPAAMRKHSSANTIWPDPKRLKFSNKFRLVKELAHRDFADIIVQVVKKFPASNGSTELYVTDYTENKEMFLYTPPEQEDEREREGDTFGYTGAPKKSWPGPYGQLVLKVELRHPHAGYANDNVDEGEFVVMKNVRVKVYHHLEGNMWPDQDNPAEVKIFKLKTLEMPEIVSLVERKDKYWTARNAKLGRAAQQGQEKKKLTKTEKKKLRKQREAEQAAAAANGAKSKLVDSISKAQSGTTNGTTKIDINPHVQCANEDVPIRSIKEILDPANERHSYSAPDGKPHILPFINAKSRARVRVLGFEPRQLEEFSVPQTPARDDESEDLPMADYESSPKYEWSFSLLLEDASKPKGTNAGPEDQTWVNVHHSDAQYLLGNGVDDPADLHHDHRLLSKLREKLCILWGNLEEKTGDQALSNRPFECCLSEYGVEMDEDDPERGSHPFGWMRMYNLSGVTIR